MMGVMSIVGEQSEKGMAMQPRKDTSSTLNIIEG